MLRHGGNPADYLKFKKKARAGGCSLRKARPQPALLPSAHTGLWDISSHSCLYSNSTLRRRPEHRPTEARGCLGARHAVLRVMTLTKKLRLEDSRFLSNRDIHLVLHSNKASRLRGEKRMELQWAGKEWQTHLLHPPSLKSKTSAWAWLAWRALSAF